jgi:bacillithiol system protein YtxJ
MALNRLNSGEDFHGVKVYYLDLLKFRSLSDFIAEKYQVAHESPQVLLLAEGKCVFHASHNAIIYHVIASEIKKVSLKITS